MARGGGCVHIIRHSLEILPLRQMLYRLLACCAVLHSLLAWRAIHLANDVRLCNARAPERKDIAGTIALLGPANRSSFRG